jgi:hypothetical protein
MDIRLLTYLSCVSLSCSSNDFDFDSVASFGFIKKINKQGPGVPLINQCGPSCDRLARITGNRAAPCCPARAQCQSAACAAAEAMFLLGTGDW